MTLSPSSRPLLLVGLAAGLLLGVSGCDGDGSGNTSVRAHARNPYATGSRYDAASAGSGARSTADRSPSDPLRSAYYGLPLRPALAPQPLVLFNSGYVTGYDTQRQLPLWVCYRLSDADHTGAAPAKHEVASAEVDPRLGSHQVMPDPKAAPGIRGLALAPQRAITASYGERAGEECDYTSDILPSATPPGWNQLLELEGRYAHANHELWVMTGPVLKDGTSTEVTALWKIQIVVQQGRTVSQAFILPVSPPAAGGERDRDAAIDLADALTTIHEIERQTHLTFLPQLGDIDGQSVAEVITLPAPGVWPIAGAVAATATRPPGRRSGGD